MTLKGLLNILTAGLLPVAAMAGSVQHAAQPGTVRQLGSSIGGQCRLKGVVTLAPASNGTDYDFYLQDATGGVLLHARRRWPVAVGDNVEVSGVVRSPHSVAVQNVVRSKSSVQIHPRAVSI
jgi:hypothetical protein